MHERGIKILGTPFGTPEYIQTFWDTRASERAQLLNIIPKLLSRQASWLMLYFCAVPRMNYLLRALPPPDVQPLAADHDAAIQGTFRQIFAIPSEPQWNARLHGIPYSAWVHQSQLPLRLGGMGLRDSQRTSAAAYWASWADALPEIIGRFPGLGQRALYYLTTLHSAANPTPGMAPACLVATEMARRTCVATGWQ